MAVAAATGFFDGVHSGHRAVLCRITEIAGKRGLGSALVTFWPHPRFILHQDPGCLHLLNTLEEKIALLKECGIDDVHVVPFSRELSEMPAARFISEYLIGRYNVNTLVIGYDHRLGSDNLSGDKLAEVALKCGLEVSTVAETEVGDSHVSSTVIRGLIEKGDFGKASTLLGYDWSVRYKDVSSGLKILPSAGRYRVRIIGGTDAVDAECEMDGYKIKVTGIGRGLEPDDRITFLERIF